ncbi:LON peptidase substrate-binding domain-containing protein [Colwellia sp. MEBiC06753]
MKLPIFPLPVYLLPGGVTQLRIFEQRYLNMVKRSEQTHGFAIVHTKDNKRLSQWASWVDIIDFDTGSDGMLNITVKCKQLVKISDIAQQPDKLFIANVEPIPHWPEVVNTPECQFLKEHLIALFEAHPSLQKLYDHPDFEHDDWVCARWVELLPIDFEEKEHFAEANTFDKAVEFLTTVFGGELSQEKN